LISSLKINGIATTAPIRSSMKTTTPRMIFLAIILFCEIYSNLYLISGFSLSIVNISDFWEKNKAVL